MASPPAKRQLSTQDGLKEAPEHEVLGGVVPSLRQHCVIVCKTPAAFSGQGPPTGRLCWAGASPTGRLLWAGHPTGRLLWAGPPHRPPSLGWGPRSGWEPTSQPRPLWPSPQPCPDPRPRPPGLPRFLSQTLICPQPGRPGGLQGPHGTTLGSAGEPRSGARDQDGQGRVRGHGGPSAARSACSLQCAHLRGKQDRERRELSVLSVD